MRPPDRQDVEDLEDGQAEQVDVDQLVFGAETRGSVRGALACHDLRYDPPPPGVMSRTSAAQLRAPSIKMPPHRAAIMPRPRIATCSLTELRQYIPPAMSMPKAMIWIAAPVPVLTRLLKRV